MVCSISAMEENEAYIAKLEYHLDGMLKELLEIEQILGKVLGYPKYKNYQKSFPGAADADGVCVGDHTAVTLAMEAADKLDSFTEWWS